MSNLWFNSKKESNSYNILNIMTSKERYLITKDRKDDGWH